MAESGRKSTIHVAEMSNIDRGITLLSVVGKVFCKILNNRLVQYLDKEGALHEGQAGFRLNRGCMDNVYTLLKLC